MTITERNLSRPYKTQNERTEYFFQCRCIVKDNALKVMMMLLDDCTRIVVFDIRNFEVGKSISHPHDHNKVSRQIMS